MIGEHPKARLFPGKRQERTTALSPITSAFVVLVTPDRFSTSSPCRVSKTNTSSTGVTDYGAASGPFFLWRWAFCKRGVECLQMAHLRLRPHAQIFISNIALLLRTCSLRDATNDPRTKSVSTWHISACDILDTVVGQLYTRLFLLVRDGM